MTNQVTVDKLLEMRLSAMSDAFLIQLNDPQMQDVPFPDRFGMLVDAEYTNRKNNSLKRLIEGASFDQPEAHIADIDYTSGRKLNRTLIERLATCEYIAEYRNIFITVATGSGKTYMACALGMEACKQASRPSTSGSRICFWIWRLQGRRTTSGRLFSCSNNFNVLAISRSSVGLPSAWAITIS